jgi:hypothetical protein
MKKIYHAFCEIFGEQDFFFNEDFKLIHWWDKNDATWREEYMNPLMEKLGIKINNIELTDKRVYSIIKDVLISCGADNSDFE